MYNVIKNELKEVVSQHFTGLSKGKLRLNIFDRTVNGGEIERRNTHVQSPAAAPDPLIIGCMFT